MRVAHTDLDIPSPESTLGRVHGIDSRHMKRAALYARVSTDRQAQQATIESQVLELKKQIAQFGNVLVKEYIDDGYSGKMLDRPALEELRHDAKGDVFDAIYFHSADRLASRQSPIGDL